MYTREGEVQALLPLNLPNLVARPSVASGIITHIGGLLQKKYRKVAIEMDELDRLERLDRRMTIMDLEMDEESVIISEATGRKVSQFFRPTYSLISREEAKFT